MKSIGGNLHTMKETTWSQVKILEMFKFTNTYSYCLYTDIVVLQVVGTGTGGEIRSVTVKKSDQPSIWSIYILKLLSIGILHTYNTITYDTITQYICNDCIYVYTYTFSNDRSWSLNHKRFRSQHGQTASRRKRRTMTVPRIISRQKHAQRAATIDLPKSGGRDHGSTLTQTLTQTLTHLLFFAVY